MTVLLLECDLRNSKSGCPCLHCVFVPRFPARSPCGSVFLCHEKNAEACVECSDTKLKNSKHLRSLSLNFNLKLSPTNRSLQK